MASAMYSTGDRVIGIHIGIGIYNGNDTGSCSDSGSGSDRERVIGIDRAGVLWL